MSTDPKGSCSRDLSEFDDKNEILAVKNVYFDCEGAAHGTRVSAIITTGFDTDEEMDNTSDAPTPGVKNFDPKIYYSELLELRRQCSLSGKKSSSGQPSPTESHFNEIGLADFGSCPPTSIFKSLSVNLPLPKPDMSMKKMLSTEIVDTVPEKMNFLYGKRRLTVFNEISSTENDDEEAEEDSEDIEEISHLALQLR